MELNVLVGKKINKVRMNDEYLVFETDNGDFGFTVEGDCCSHSYFYDFYGVEKLLQNGVVTSVKQIDLPVRPETVNSNHDDVQAYGYEIVTKHEYYGEQTSVFSFRNSSNGYYGGWMHSIDSFPKNVPVITNDTLIS